MAKEIEFSVGPPWVSVKFPLPDGSTDDEVFEHLLTELDDYRVLYAGFPVEYAAEVIQAVQRMRSIIGQYALKLKPTSKISRGLRQLRGACVEFLGKSKELSEALVYRHNLDKANMAAGMHLMDDQVERVQHYELRGGPDLLTNTRLNICDIQPAGTQILFTQALGELRGRFGSILSDLCQTTSTALPENLVALTPDLDLLSGDLDASDQPA